MAGFLTGDPAFSRSVCRLPSVIPPASKCNPAGFQMQSRGLPNVIPRAPKCNPAGSHLAYGMSNQYLRCHQT